ncbi:MAG: PfkB family carbohydrate kinase [bacterium]
MSGSKFQVVGLGQCSIDYLGIVERYPPADAKCEFTRMVIQGGGPVATAMVALSRWGVKCTFTGVVGSDSFGDEIIRSLNEEGVDTTGCGDVFNAGFTFGLINGWDKLKCLDFGAWAASRVSLKLGGRTGIPNVKDYSPR